MNYIIWNIHAYEYCNGLNYITTVDDLHSMHLNNLLHACRIPNVGTSHLYTCIVWYKIHVNVMATTQHVNSVYNPNNYLLLPDKCLLRIFNAPCIL